MVDIHPTPYLYFFDGRFSLVADWGEKLGIFFSWQSIVAVVHSVLPGIKKSRVVNSFNFS